MINGCRKIRDVSVGENSITPKSTVGDGPSVEHLKNIAKLVGSASKSLGLSQERVDIVQATAGTILNCSDTDMQFRAADQLGAIMKTGNLKARKLAIAIVNELQLTLPGIMEPLPATDGGHHGS
jgi:hypothetical protein